MRNKKHGKGKSNFPLERVTRSILIIRGHKVMLDADLAALYGVTTKRLNEQVKRNFDRFPEDFMFHLTETEKNEVVANCGHLARLKFSPVLPAAFTEHGAIMAAAVLNSARAVEISVFVVRAFVKMRELTMVNKEIVQKLAQLESEVGGHDEAIAGLIDAIRQLMAPPEPKKKRSIGFAPWKEEK